MAIRKPCACRSPVCCALFAGKAGGKIGIGDRITVVQDTFGKVFNEGTEFQRDGSQFDQLFQEGDTFHIGQMRGEVMHTPGHTPACLTMLLGTQPLLGIRYSCQILAQRDVISRWIIGNVVPIHPKILALPDETRIFVGHDYKAPGRDEYAWETTVGEQKAKNIHIGAGKSEEEFTTMRDERDATLAMPKLIIPSCR